MTRFVARKPRVWDLYAPVTGFLLPDMKDWPSHVQDQIYGAMETLVTKTGVKSLDIIQAIAFYDLGIWQVKVTVMEHLTPDDVLVLH